ncbi:MAG TPA: ABC transporter ATP-binding protein, partial [Pyrinomonadaceae bacterium]
AVDLYFAPDPSRPVSGFALLIKESAGAVGLGGSASAGAVFIACLFFLASLASLFVMYAQGFLLQKMGQSIIYDIRLEIFAHLQKLPVQFYDRNPIGRLITRLTTDVDALNEMFTSALLVVFGDIAMALFIVVYMFKVDWSLALVSFLILPLLLVLTVWFRRGTRAAFRQIRLQLARLNAFLQERLSGITVIQLFNREAKELRRFDQINEAHRRANVGAVYYYAFFYPAVGLIEAAGLAMIIWYGGGQVLAKVTTLGTLIAFIQLVGSFYDPISDISERYSTVQLALASAERIFQLLDEPETIRSPDHPVRLPPVRGRIEFRNVWFAYTDDDWVLKDVSFVIEPGQRVAFVGYTGAGKTTIASLLLRFYDIQRGQILFDDIDIREMDMSELRTNFSVVQQDVFLFSGDIASNIKLGDTGITEQKLRAAAREVHADAFIQALPHGYATEVRERGAGLSFGQKQLISFARALAFDPSVLILDEATSSIDTKTEQLIGDAVKRLMKGRTSLVIAHRLATIESVDQIIVLHQGEIREQGTHLELLAARGFYWRLYRLNFYQDY